MKYSLEESMQEFSRRTNILQRKRHQRMNKVMFSCVGVQFVVLITALHAFIGPTIPDQGESNYGSFLLSQEAGSYVIIALIAFALGILLAVAILHKSGRLKKRGHIAERKK